MDKDVTFKIMENWSIAQLRDRRLKLRKKLGEEIQKRDALKAEIMYLQTEITMCLELG